MPYNGTMDRIADKTIVLLIGFASLALQAPSTLTVCLLLVSVTCAALFEIAPNPIRLAAPALLALIGCVCGDMTPFLGLCAYDLARTPNRPYAAAVVVIPLLSALTVVSPAGVVLSACACLAAVMLSLRTTAQHTQREETLRARDALKERTVSLAMQNRDLLERQEYEVQLATLEERARIAREIHDNVGHLLTRSILQTEAFRVVSSDDAETAARFDAIANTLHEALDDVRASVHDLHDTSVSIDASLRRILDNSTLYTKLDIAVESMPSPYAACCCSLVKEALSNTARHSNATEVTISLIEHPALWQLVITDNGTRKPHPEPSGGMGLTSMEARVRALDGIFRAHFEDGRGFVVFASLPKPLEGDQ